MEGGDERGGDADDGGDARAIGDERVAAARAMADEERRRVRGGGEIDDGDASNDRRRSLDGERIATALRSNEPLLDMKQRTTHDDPEHFMGTFFRASRLHYIGSWRARYETFLDDETTTPPPLPPPAAKNGERLVMHVDMDCFFAAVAALGRPELRDLPIAVSWSSGGQGELSSCNYAARAFSCKAGMRVGHAKSLCPRLVVMPYEFEKYSEIALEVYRVLHAITPHVMGVSVDEAYVDVTQRANAGEDARAIAEDVRRKIFAKTGCAASVGSGPNRLIARLATKRAKPDGAFHVSLAAAPALMSSLPAAELPGVGRGAMKKLAAAGVGGGGGVGGELELTCADVVSAPLTSLQRALGPKAGVALRDAARGVDTRAWEARPPRRSVGAQVTWGVRFVEASEAVAFVTKLVTEVATRMKRVRVKGKSLTLKILRAVANAPESMMKGNIGHGACDSLTRTITLSSFTDAAAALASNATKLLADLNIPADQIRGVGVQVSKLDSDPSARGGGTGAAKTARSAPAGKRKNWMDR